MRRNLLDIEISAKPNSSEAWNFHFEKALKIPTSKLDINSYLLKNKNMVL